MASDKPDRPDRPAGSEAPERAEKPERSDRAERPAEEELHGRGFLERTLPDLIKRAVEVGVEKLTEGPENLRNLVEGMRVPKEIMHVLLSQVDETKNGLYRVVAREIRDFLEHTNVSDEMTKALTKLSFEIKTEIRFIPNDAGTEEGGAKFPKPDVRASVHVKNARRRNRDE